MRCDDLTNDRLLDALLSGDADADVAAHLKDCASCRRRQAELRNVLGGLRALSGSQSPAVNGDLVDRVLAGLPASETSHAKTRSRGKGSTRRNRAIRSARLSSSWAGPAAILAAGIALTVGLVLLYAANQSGRAQPPHSSASAPDAPRVEPAPSVAARQNDPAVDKTRQPSQKRQETADTPTRPESGKVTARSPDSPSPAVPPMPAEKATADLPGNAKTPPTPEPSLAESQPETERPIARIVKIDGLVKYARGSAGTWAKAVAGVSLLAGDRLDARNGKLKLDLAGAGTVYVNQGTLLRILTAKSAGGSSPLVRLDRGEVYVLDVQSLKPQASSLKPLPIHVETPDGLVSPVGTRFGVRRIGTVTVVIVEEGSVNAWTKALRKAGNVNVPVEETIVDPASAALSGKSIRLRAGWQTRLRRGDAPGTPKRASTLRLASWAMSVGLPANVLVRRTLKKNLVARWAFDETVLGAVASSGRINAPGRHTNLVAPYGPSADVPAVDFRTNRSLRFDNNTRSRVDIPFVPALNTPTGFTVSFFFKADQNDGSILAKPYRDQAKNSWQIEFRGGNLSFTSCDGRNHTLDEACAPPAGSWAHVAATWDGKIKRMYINGKEKVAVQRKIAFDNHGIVVGGDYNDGNFVAQFLGNVDDLRLYDRALTAEEVQALGKARDSKP